MPKRLRLRLHSGSNLTKAARGARAAYLAKMSIDDPPLLEDTETGQVRPAPAEDLLTPSEIELLRQDMRESLALLDQLEQEEEANITEADIERAVEMLKRESPLLAELIEADSYERPEGNGHPGDEEEEFE